MRIHVHEIIKTYSIYPSVTTLEKYLNSRTSLFIFFDNYKKIIFSSDARTSPVLCMKLSKGSTERKPEACKFVDFKTYYLIKLLGLV